MTVATWQAGVLYQPGAVVRPTVAAQVSSGSPINADFEAGISGWATTPSWDIASVPAEAFGGTWRARFLDPGIANSTLRNAAALAVKPGQTVGGWVYVQPIGAGRGRVALEWRDAASAILTTDPAEQWTEGSAGFWRQSSVSATAPPNAATVKLVLLAESVAANNGALFDHSGFVYAFQGTTSDLVFKAVQADAGTSGTSEPVWPTVAGNQVVDNQVTWQAFATDRVTWEAHDILVSGAAEPAFPAFAGAFVPDNTIAWEAVPRRITDTRAPRSAIVVMGASKVFAAANDIIPFSATVNPKDWSARADAGYLPFGLQLYGSNPVSAMGLYRGNLVAFNSNAFQMWQIDEDPASMALLDAVPIGCEHNLTLQPVADDLLFLAQLGVRNISIAGGSTNLQAGYLGKPVDPLVQQAMQRSRQYGYEPRALYYPSAGQYWLFTVDDYEDAKHCVAYVLTFNGNGRSWSRYVWPALDPATNTWLFNDWAILAGDLYLRFGPDDQGHVVRVSEHALFDDQTMDVFFTAGAGATGQVGYSASSYTPADAYGTLTTNNSPESLHVLAVSYISATVFRVAAKNGTTTPPVITDLAEVLFLDNAGATQRLLGSAATFTTAGEVATWQWTVAAVGFTADAAYRVLIQAENAPGRAEEPIAGVSQWPWLDMGEPGRSKQLIGFDLAGEAPLTSPARRVDATTLQAITATGGAQVSVGFDQTQTEAFTTPYETSLDNTVGGLVPLPVAGPSFSFRVDVLAGQRWELNAATLYVQDLRRTA